MRRRNSRNNEFREKYHLYNISNSSIMTRFLITIPVFIWISIDSHDFTYPSYFLIVLLVAAIDHNNTSFYQPLSFFSFFSVFSVFSFSPSPRALSSPPLRSYLPPPSCSIFKYLVPKLNSHERYW